jgi:hypothetical protein
VQNHLLFACTPYPLESANRLQRTALQQILPNDAKGAEKSLRQMPARVPCQIDGKTDGSLLSFHFPDMDEHAGFRHPGRNLKKNPNPVCFKKE